jgi:uncharacterized surface protein with fasciclin (FAS1) repeats
MRNSTTQKLLSAVLSLAGLGMFAAAPALAEELRSTSAGANAGSVELADMHMTPTGDAMSNTIVDVAAGNDAFSTLVTAVQAADLVEALSGEGPFTVFAPTNDAFAALPPEVLEALLLPENKDLLTEVLAYHVVPDTVTSAGLRGPRDLETLNGPVNISSTRDELFVNDAQVIAIDLEASNGVIHAIDAVLIPDGLVETLTARMAEAEIEEEVVTPTTTTTTTTTTTAPTTTTTTTTAPATTTTTTPVQPVQGLW